MNEQKRGKMRQKQAPKNGITGWFTKEEEIRFLKYLAIGLLSFGFDIFLMWTFMDLFGVHYIIGASVAFILATIFNYSLNRVWSFRGTKTKPLGSYMLFLTIATLNLVVIAGLLYVFVEFFHIPALISRIIAGLILFVSNFILNSVFVFKIFPKNKK